MENCNKCHRYNTCPTIQTWERIRDTPLRVDKTLRTNSERILADEHIKYMRENFCDTGKPCKIDVVLTLYEKGILNNHNMADYILFTPAEAEKLPLLGSPARV